MMVKCGVDGAALESERRERHQREQQVGRRWNQGAAEHHRTSMCTFSSVAAACGAVHVPSTVCRRQEILAHIFASLPAFPISAKSAISLNIADQSVY